MYFVVIFSNMFWSVIRLFLLTGCEDRSIPLPLFRCFVFFSLLLNCSRTSVFQVEIVFHLHLEEIMRHTIKNIMLSFHCLFVSAGVLDQSCQCRATEGSRWAYWTGCLLPTLRWIRLRRPPGVLYPWDTACAAGLTGPADDLYGSGGFTQVMVTQLYDVLLCFSKFRYNYKGPMSLIILRLQSISIFLSKHLSADRCITKSMRYICCTASTAECNKIHSK